MTPRAIADRSNLVLRLDPEPLVARVAMATSMVRIGMAWLRREVEISRWLAERRTLVTRPTTRVAAGPFERAGMVISFWDLEDVVAERAEPEAAGAALGDLHGALADYDRSALPEWGAWEEVRLVMDHARRSPLFDASDRTRLERSFEKASRIVEGAKARSASFQAVHGDAHIANVLATPRGAVWTDWEDAFVGPREYDVACLRSKADLFGEEREAIDRMTAAYAARCEYDRGLAEDLGYVRNVQVVPWLAVFAERHPDLVPRMRARFAKL
ncbi:MAG: aminoglycoside phosphotransferase family protein [Deltaproteobacteria bacterium]|nr:aminoglycoside phosphotransferase family protein [Deltaproteobacteria bacterium]